MSETAEVIQLRKDNGGRKDLYEVGEISKKTLTQTLRSLESDGLVARRVLAELLDRLLVNLSEGVPFVLNQRFDAPLHRLSIRFGRFSESIQLRLQQLETPVDVNVRFHVGRRAGMMVRQRLSLYRSNVVLTRATVSARTTTL